jgi:hypothetical protein
MPFTDEDKKWLEARFEAQTKWLETRFDVQMRETRDLIETTETKLLTGFHKWASPMELRVQSHATAIRVLDLELENVKERLSKLEPRQ